jgi:hypothetical protein
MFPLLSVFAVSLRYRGPRRSDPWVPPLYNFSQSVDHSNSSSPLFSQRYFEVSNWTANPPSYAILSIGGESDDFTADGVGDFVGLLAQDLNASVFTLEHRYFGTSFPASASTANYTKYLTIEQALGDLRVFAQKIAADRGWNVKWLIAGGSYSGLLSSYARQRDPDVFHAAFSSSGVVLANDNYTEFDLQIGISMGQECASVARGARLEIERLLDSGQQDWVLRQFGCEDVPEDFAFVLGDVFSIGPQYSQRAKLCDPLVDTLRTGADAVMVLAQFTRDYFIPHFCDGDVAGSYSRKVMKAGENATENVGARSWQWLTCNELGYWQVAPGRLSVRPKALNTSWFEDQCRDIFGDEWEGLDVNKTNLRYGGLAQNASRVFYSTGSQDPWTWVCITEESGAPSGSVAHTIVGPEMGHCRDWWEVKSTDPPDLQRTQNYERALFRQWMNEP